MSVAVTLTSGAHLFAPALAAFQREHPNVEVRVRLAHTWEALGLILDGVAQLALISGIVTHPQIESVASFTSPLTLAAGKHYPRAVIRHRRRSSNPAADALAEALRKVLPGLGGVSVVH